MSAFSDRLDLLEGPHILMSGTDAGFHEFWGFDAGTYRIYVEGWSFDDQNEVTTPAPSVDYVVACMIKPNGAKMGDGIKNHGAFVFVAADFDEALEAGYLHAVKICSGDTVRIQASHNGSGGVSRLIRIKIDRTE